jgi:hypothetical protein
VLWGWILTQPRCTDGAPWYTDCLKEVRDLTVGAIDEFANLAQRSAVVVLLEAAHAERDASRGRRLARRTGERRLQAAADRVVAEAERIVRASIPD